MYLGYADSLERSHRSKSPLPGDDVDDVLEPDEDLTSDPMEAAQSVLTGEDGATHLLLLYTNNFITTTILYAWPKIITL